MLIGGFGRSVETTAASPARSRRWRCSACRRSGCSTYVADVSGGDARSGARGGAAVTSTRPAPTSWSSETRSIFYDGLRRVRPNAERIPVSELNLDRAALR